MRTAGTLPSIFCIMHGIIISLLKENISQPSNILKHCSGNSLVVQWLQAGFFTAMAQVQLWSRKLDSKSLVA